MNKILNSVQPENIDTVDRIFYICSYTGSGTMLLRRELIRQGHIAKIVHDRNPPKELEFVGPFFKFNGIKVPEKYLHKFTIIYIYKNPINSIYSRLSKKNFSKFVMENNEVVDFNDVITQEKDLYGLEEFFDNYTNTEQNRNYKIICVNYHKLFDNKNELSELLGVQPLNIKKKEKEHEQKHYDTLLRIYQPLIDKLNKKPFITII